MTLLQPVRVLRFIRVSTGAAALLVLGGCATLTSAEAPGYEDTMTMARTRVDAGQVREAVVALERAAALQPANKQPWLEIASLRAGQGRHVDALAAAEQVLRRDPADATAYDITIGSGLQVALETMKRLRASGAPPSEDRSRQAREIAAVMAEVFGAESLIPDEVKTRLARQAVAHYKANRVERLPDAQTQPKGDPLDLLGGD